MANTSSQLWLDYVFAVNDVSTDSYHRSNNFTRLSFYNTSALPTWVATQLLIITPARLALVDLVNKVRHEGDAGRWYLPRALSRHV